MIIDETTTDEAIKVMAAMQGWTPPVDVTGRLIRPGDWVGVATVANRGSARIRIGRAFPVAYLDDFDPALDRAHESVRVYRIEYGSVARAQRFNEPSRMLVILAEDGIPATLRASLAGDEAAIRARHRKKS